MRSMMTMTMICRLLKPQVLRPRARPRKWTARLAPPRRKKKGKATERGK